MASRITNLGDLRRQVLSTLWKDVDDPDFAGEVDGWVAQAEEKIADELRVRQMIVRACEDIRERYLTLPSDWLEAIDLRIVNLGPLLSMPREQTAHWAHGTTPAYYVGGLQAGGYPCRYAIMDDQLEIIPDVGAPTENFFHLEMVYYARPKTLLEETDTNSVLRDFPTIYLYGTLAYSAPHLDHDDRLQTWASLFSDAITSANISWERARQSGSRRNARIRVA